MQVPGMAGGLPGAGPPMDMAMAMGPLGQGADMGMGMAVPGMPMGKGDPMIMGKGDMGKFGKGAKGFSANAQPDVQQVLGAYIGQIKSFNATHGFGFIVCEGLQQQGFMQDVYLHHNQIGECQPGQMVSFTAYLNKKGQPQAMDLKDVGSRVTRKSCEIMELPECRECSWDQSRCRLERGSRSGSGLAGHPGRCPPSSSFPLCFSAGAGLPIPGEDESERSDMWSDKMVEIWQSDPAPALIESQLRGPEVQLCPNEHLGDSVYCRSMLKGLCGLDDASLTTVITGVLQKRPELAPGVVNLAVPELTYVPADALTQRRASGKVGPPAATGFCIVDCPELKAVFGEDVLVHMNQVGTIPPGTEVNFAILLNQEMRPQAFDLQPIGPIPRGKGTGKGKACGFRKGGLLNAAGWWGASEDKLLPTTQSVPVHAARSDAAIRTGIDFSPSS
ncbi:unnamed protein product [Symbiodinium necroappetens]|uniref:CSD domain-containing protein n=1 Tax=Symbiodinium necroappetens TaxID=1628268 RepID=A0A813C8Y1_9DINO|nr:unnamed protein product [Symbiodinium necroappetens]